MDKVKIGKFGQKIAAEFLQKRGYIILAENFLTRFGEIDLVAQSGPQIVFVEVKTRLSQKFGLPEEAIDANKKEKLLQAGLEYLAKNQVLSDNYRFDCVAIEIERAKKIARIRHHKGI